MFRLQRSLIEGLDDDKPDIEDIRAALQSAIELEHSTIPLYLYAMYSLDAELNSQIVAILRSVVVEEMLHMVLAANVLNAIGGRPQLAGPSFYPHFPGQLPGGVDGQLQLHLRKFSFDQLSVFIALEEPRDPIAGLSPLGPDSSSCTIGEFYQAIEAAIAQMGSEAFGHSDGRQIGPDLVFGSVLVHDLSSAIEAINTIIEQGEGTTASPQEIDGPGGINDFAHHYRLSEVLLGRRLIFREIDGVSRYDYLGEPIILDHDGIFDLPDDPRAQNYDEGSDERLAIDEFNYFYTTLLNSLHNLINGISTGASFLNSLGHMSELDRRAREMARGATTRGRCIGPTFEYQPMNPVAMLARGIQTLDVEDDDELEI